jgi:hypothetical protein
MKRALVYFSCILAGCSQALTVGTGQDINPAVNYSCPTGANVMTVTVNGSLCSSDQYVNEPCASVTLCQPGSTTNCQTINNILVDTGSFGLRVFASAINSTVSSQFTNILATAPTKTSDGSSATSTAECVEFGSGRTWGQVMTADVYLAGEPYSRVPIQLINSSYSGGDSQSSVNCNGSDVSPSSAGYNGILGIGLFDTDCGSSCTGVTPAAQYYACDGTLCSGIGSHGANVATTSQVSNPVAHFSSGSDTNGLVFLTASANGNGNAADNGCVVFGVNTETNNIPATGTNLYPSTSATDAQFTVVLGGRSYTGSFLDSGSNALYLDPNISISECSGWYCPGSTLTESFTITGIGSNFLIANSDNLFNTGNSVFSDLGGPAFSGTIDLGIPFFYGRPVWIGITGKTTTGATYGNTTGPYWAY